MISCPVHVRYFAKKVLIGYVDVNDDNRVASLDNSHLENIMILFEYCHQTLEKTCYVRTWSRCPLLADTKALMAERLS